MANAAEFTDTMQQFAQIGPPRNMTVEAKPTGDGYVVSWYPPDYGLESLRVYLVRWYREPGHFLHGTAETRDNYYTGKLFLSMIYTVIVNISFVFSETFNRR